MMVYSLKRQHGMTLMEVLIAIFIFAISSAAIINVVMSSVNGMSNLEESYFAQLVADNVLVEYKINSQWPGNNWVSDKVEMADRQWYFRYRGQNTQDASFKSMEVEVSLSNKFENNLGYLRTYLSR